MAEQEPVKIPHAETKVHPSFDWSLCRILHEGQWQYPIELTIKVACTKDTSVKIRNPESSIEVIQYQKWDI